MSDTHHDADGCNAILESWSAGLAGAEPLTAEVQAHLADCAECRRAAAEMERVWNGLGGLAASAPTAVLRRDFDAVLASYREGMTSPSLRAYEDGRGGSLPIEGQGAARFARGGAFRRQRTLRRRVYQLGYGIAAALAGILVGIAIRPDAHRQEVAEMRSELRALRQEVTLSMLQQTSASARLEGVSAGAQLARQDPEVLRALLQTLATDPSPNVRLAAVDALAARAAEPGVQQRLGDALRKEASPLVQIALADALLSADGEGARRIVAPLATKAGVRPEVRQYVRQRLGSHT
jgi:hypothetical protein